MPALIEAPISQLDSAQTVKAVRALQAHLASLKANPTSGKQNLLENDDSADDSTALDAADPDMAMWLQVTTKKYITDQKKLKPSKITLPNPYLSISPTLTICLIVKDPSTAYKALIPALNLPSTSTLKITTPTKLKTKYRTYEARRQLERAHDLFLADDRVITTLPGIMGKSVYKRTSKIPIPVNIAGKAGDAKGLKAEIEKALNATYLHLSPSTCHSVRVGNRTMAPEKIAENVAVVVEKLVTKYVPGGYEGLKGLHVKAANTIALPIWLTDTLFTAEDVLAEEEVKKIEHGKTEEGRKEREEKKKEARKVRKAEWEEKRKTRRHWDSDVEDETAPLMIEPASKKRKAEEPKVAEVEKAGTAPAVAPVAESPVAKKQKVDAKAKTKTKSVAPVLEQKKVEKVEAPVKRTKSKKEKK